MNESKRQLSLLTEDDLYLWNEGTHYRLYRHLGAHRVDDTTYFAVWAPNADSVSVIGEWNGWAPDQDPLIRRGGSGIWEGLAPDARLGHAYKFRIVNGKYSVDKADPFGLFQEMPPRTASKIWSLEHTWTDQEWMATRKRRIALDAPLSIYEAHLGSWRRDEEGRHLTYLRLAQELPEYVADLGFTHVELLPVMEHPFYGSWGYQTTGYFAPTARYGTPQDFMTLIDAFHQRGIGVILDWVPSHFPNDQHGLAYFDGTHLFEHADPRMGYHPDWKSYIYNLGRNEVAAFLISNALFWLDHYHVDGLRVDAVASMLYRDYSRSEGEWVPNIHGGNENLEAVAFLRQLNQAVYINYPDVQTFAEESTSWPKVTKPAYDGGLGFGFKWDMGWMHDTLDYLSHDPVRRSHQHHLLTFRGMYAFAENYVLPLSHDEVVHGKRSLLAKMRGDGWQMYANLRILLCYQYTQPGKKLLFMGSELAQPHEWSHESQLGWSLLDQPEHGGISRLVGDLNRLYRDYPALHATDSDPSGFEWAVVNDAARSVFAHLRHAEGEETLLVVHNLTPHPRASYRIGVPTPGRWVEILNSDAEIYGGSGVGNLGGVMSEPIAHTGSPDSVQLSLPPLASIVLKHLPTGDEEE